jgi:hypothetical protein
MFGVGLLRVGYLLQVNVQQLILLPTLSLGSSELLHTLFNFLNG